MVSAGLENTSMYSPLQAAQLGVQKCSRHCCLRRSSEKITRLANEEENCKGRYCKARPALCPSGRPFGRPKTFPMFLWGGRFKSQATSQTNKDQAHAAPGLYTLNANASTLCSPRLSPTPVAILFHWLTLFNTSLLILSASVRSNWKKSMTSIANA